MASLDPASVGRVRVDRVGSVALEVSGGKSEHGGRGEEGEGAEHAGVLHFDGGVLLVIYSRYEVFA